MGISAEVLNSVLEEMHPKLEMTFWRYSPVLAKIIDGGGVKKESLKGPYKKFRLMTRGPGQITPIVSGSERLYTPRFDTVTQGSVYASRMVYRYNIPSKELAEANSDTDVENIFEQYPQAAYLHFSQELAKQLLLGNGSGTSGFLTWNGGANYTSEDGSRTGAFEFLAPASQNDTVFGVKKRAASGGVTDWYNQFADIVSSADDGEDKLRACYYACSRFSPQYGAPNLIVADETSFLNHVKNRAGRVMVIDSIKGEKGAEDVKNGLAFEGATIYVDDLMALDNASVISNDGIMYVINTKSWEIYTLGTDDKVEGKGWFSKSGPMRDPMTESWIWEMNLHAGMYTRCLASNGVVTGGWIE